jgi:hypothetical protein
MTVSSPKKVTDRKVLGPYGGEVGIARGT